MTAKLKSLARWSAFAFLLTLWQPCFGQFNSSVEGTVSDPTGAMVPGAQVTLHDLQTNIDLNGSTGPSGYYRFSGVGPDRYQVIVAAKGFITKTTDVQVTQDEAAAVNVKLALTGATAVVNVTSVTNQLNPDETRLQVTLDAQQIENLPLQNGSVLEVVRTAPGVTGIDETRSMSAVSIYGNIMYAQADGRSNQGSSYLVDGVSIQDNGDYASNITGEHPLAFMPSQDMVAEVSLEVNNYDVDWGSGSSMKINITTKGGTNKFHGTVGDRYNSRGLNSTPDFTSPAAPNSTKWYTASIGGPIWKDKTFFFVSYLHQTETNSVPSLIQYATNEFTTTWAAANYPEPADNMTTTAPSQGMNVNYLLVPFPAYGAGVPASADVVAGQVASIQQTGVLATAATSTDWGHTFGPWETSPGDCSVPVWAGPSFTSGGGHLIARNSIPCTMNIVDEGEYSQSPRVDGFLMDGRIDQDFRAGKDRLYADYSLLPQISDFIWWRPGFNCETPGGSRYLNFNYTHIFNPNLIAQTAASYVRFYNSFTPDPANVIPFLSLLIGTADGATDYFGTPADPAWQKNNTSQLHEDVTYTHGRHTVKAGFSFVRAIGYVNDTWLAKAQVPLYFGFSDLLDDQPDSYGLDTLSGKTGTFVPDITGAVANEIGLYGEDAWQVKPNLLVNLGMRWDDYGNPVPNGLGALPFYEMVSPTGATLRGNIVSDSLSTTQTSHLFPKAMDVNFLPRVGFSWTPAGAAFHKILVHGGIGMYEDALDTNGIQGGVESNSPSYLNTPFNVGAAAPLNDVDPRNFYGLTTWTGPAPWGETYTHPAIVPVGVDKHGEVLVGNGSGGTSVVTTALSSLAPHLAPQKTALYNLQIEKQLRGNFIFGVDYSGSLEWGQYANGDYNSFPGDQIANNGGYVRLSPEWSGISQWTNSLRGNYNALILTARQNINRLSWHASYTYSKNMSTGSTISDIYDANHYYGPVAGSVPFSFNGSVSYELPGRDLQNFAMRTFLAGWTVSGVTSAQSGSPFSLETSANYVPLSSALPSEGGPEGGTTDISNPSNAGGYLANGPSYYNSLVNVAPGIKRKGYSRSQWKYGIFSQCGYTYATSPSFTNAAAQGACFTNPSSYAINPVYSNQGSNSFYGPGYLDVDGALHKKIYLPWFGKEGGSTLTLGLEGSNIINRANLAAPSGQSTSATNLADPTYLGVIYSANQGRYFQVMGRFTF